MSFTFAPAPPLRAAPRRVTQQTKAPQQPQPAQRPRLRALTAQEAESIYGGDPYDRQRTALYSRPDYW